MSASLQPKEFTGRHFLVIMVTFFAIVIGVNVLMAVLAVKTWTGLVVPNSYVASQEFNKETERRMQAITAGAKSEVVEQGGFVQVSFKGKSGEFVDADKLELKVGHPVDAGLERVITFKQVSPGVYKSDTALPPGTWVGDVSATLKGYGDWVKPVRFLVKG